MSPTPLVIPAKAGIHGFGTAGAGSDPSSMDSRFRGNDGEAAIGMGA
jgi:hypothetical protein